MTCHFGIIILCLADITVLSISSLLFRLPLYSPAISDTLSEEQYRCCKAVLGKERLSASCGVPGRSNWGRWMQFFCRLLRLCFTEWTWSVTIVFFLSPPGVSLGCSSQGDESRVLWGTGHATVGHQWPQVGSSTLPCGYSPAHWRSIMIQCCYLHDSISMQDDLQTGEWQHGGLL